MVTLTKVKQRCKLLFAALSTLFAVHQFTEGFVWLGLDGISSPEVAHDMGAAFMLYAQGLLPFLLPLSVLLVHQSSDQQYCGRIALCACNLWLAVFLEDQDDGNLRRG